MAKKDFFPLNRCIQQHWIWEDKPFSKGQAWVDMLLLANYRDTKLPYKGEVVTCKRGDVNISIAALSTRWGWSRDKTRRFLELLESDEMVRVNTTTHRTTITIENYEKFQDVVATNRQQIDSKPTASRQQADITKKDKKDKNDKKCIYIRENTNSYGEFHNVFLTNSEYENLKQYNDYKKLIEEVSIWLCDHTQNNHYATCKKFIKNNGYTKKNISEPIKPSGKSEPMPDEIRTKLNDLFGG